MGGRDILDAPGLLPEGIPYIYIDMYNRSGGFYKLVQEQRFPIRSGMTMWAAGTGSK